MSDRAVEEETMRNERRMLEEEQETLSHQVKEARAMEEEEDGILQVKYMELDLAREGCMPHESDILNLIDELQGQLNGIRSRRSLLLDDLQTEAGKKSRELEGRQEDILIQLRYLEEEER